MQKTQNVSNKRLAELKAMRDHDLILLIEAKNIDLGESYVIADLLTERFSDSGRYEIYKVIDIAFSSNSSELKKAVMLAAQNRLPNTTETEDQLISELINKMLVDPSSSVSHKARDLNLALMNKTFKK